MRRFLPFLYRVGCKSYFHLFFSETSVNISTQWMIPLAIYFLITLKKNNTTQIYCTNAFHFLLYKCGTNIHLQPEFLLGLLNTSRLIGMDMILPTPQKEIGELKTVHEFFVRELWNTRGAQQLCSFCFRKIFQSWNYKFVFLCCSIMTYCQFCK